MKKKARVLKRIRQRISHENEIVRKAENGLSGVRFVKSKNFMTTRDMLLSYGMTDAQVTAYLRNTGTIRRTTRIHDELVVFDTETVPLRASMSSTFLDDGVAHHGWYKQNAHESAKTAICVQNSPSIPVRDGAYGAAGLLAPSVRAAIVHLSNAQQEAPPRLVLSTTHYGP